MQILSRIRVKKEQKTAIDAGLLLKELSSDARRYLFPGHEWTEEEEEVHSEECIETVISRECCSRNEGASFSVSSNKEMFLPLDIRPLSDASLPEALFPEVKASKSRQTRRHPAEKIRKVRHTERLTELDPRTRALIDEIEKLQKKYGITIEELEAALSYKVKLSRLRITANKSIILDDFDCREVRMDTLTKTVYLFYLKHPEGIRYKDLSDHRKELEDIYTSISGRSDLDGIRKSISDLTDSVMNNSINEKVSKAKKAFRDAVDERVARFYYIEGKQGAARNIALDRSLVIWE